MEISCGANIEIEAKGNGVCLDFAMEELKAYLLRMFSRLDFEKKRGSAKILLEVRNSPVLRYDGYQVLITEKEVRVTSRMERGVLHGVYHLLRLLGCSFWFSKASVQNIPTVRRKTLESDLFTENPMVQRRGICLYGVTGKTVADVLASVDFMAKNGYNMLVTARQSIGAAPENAHDMLWDEVEPTVLPHLEKRGIELCLLLDEAAFPLEPFSEEPLGELCEYIQGHPYISAISMWPTSLSDTGDGKAFSNTAEGRNAAIRVSAAVNAINPAITVIQCEGDSACTNPASSGCAAVLLPGTAHAFSWVNSTKKPRELYVLDNNMGDNFYWQTNLWIQPHNAKQLVACAAHAGVTGIISLWRPFNIWWSSSLNFAILREAYYHPDFSPRLMSERICDDLWSVCAPTLAKATGLLYENLHDRALWSRRPHAPVDMDAHTSARSVTMDIFNLNAFKLKQNEIISILSSIAITRFSEHERYHLDCLRAYIRQQWQYYSSIDKFNSDIDYTSKIEEYYSCLEQIHQDIGEGFPRETYARWCLSLHSPLPLNGD